MQTLIQQGWADHADKTAAVADRLEAAILDVGSAEDAAGFMNLVNHAIGDYLGDRARALRINSAVFAHLDDAEATTPLIYLAVAHRLAGDNDGAVRTEAQIGTDPATAVRVNMLVAQGHMHAQDWDTATALYSETLKAADALPAGHAGERSAAIVSNNIASEILNLEARTDLQANLMEHAAHAAHTYWSRIGTWVNSERADYLLATVHNELGRPDDALTYADRALATIQANGDEPVDQAFLCLARARAFRDLGQDEARAKALAEAEALAAAFASDGLKSWFADELAKAR